MNTSPFIIERTFNAPIDKVWKAITDKNQMKEWYFDLAEFRAEPGFQFEFEGGDKENKIYKHCCQVKEVIPHKRLSYTWRYDGYEGNSLVTFELFPEGEQGEKTRLKLTHSGLETFPYNNPDFGKTNFAQGWTHIIGASLPAFLEQA